MAFEFSTRFKAGTKYSLTGGTRCKALASPVAAAPAGGLTISNIDTESNILATTLANGTIAFATDTDIYYVYDSSVGWIFYDGAQTSNGWLI